MSDMGAMEQSVMVWLATGEVGTSSKQMAFWLAFDIRTRDFASHPLDPDDMDRCLKLLNAVPELRERLPLMADVSKEWAALVARWDEIEALQLDEIGLDWVKARSAPKTNALMNEILDAVREQQRP